MGRAPEGSPLPEPQPAESPSQQHAQQSGEAGGPSRKPSGVRPERPLWQLILVNVAIATVVISLLQAFVVRVHNVASGSMEQTLGVTDRVVSSKLPYLVAPISRGDIVIFAHGDTWDTQVRTPDSNPLKQALRYFGDVTSIGISNHLYTVKRVIGVAGDTVQCCDSSGHVQVNGVALDEPYLYEDLPFRPGTVDCATDPRSARCFGPIVVPEGALLVMGDHRSNSADSVAACRTPGALPGCAKFVQISQVTGKVLARAWPWPPGPVG